MNKGGIIYMRKKKIKEIPRSIIDVEQPKSRATRIRMLLKKNQAVFKDKQALTEFKEPVAFLIRRSGSIELYEDASKGVFSFKHSDGNNTEIYLEPSQQKTMDYGKRKFKCYILDEDNPLPLPQKPLIMAGTVNEIVEKVGLDMKKLNTRKEELRIKGIKTIGWLILAGFTLYILYKTHAFDKIIGFITGNPYTPPITNTGGTVVQSVANNSLAVASSG